MVGKEEDQGTIITRTTHSQGKVQVLAPYRSQDHWQLPVGNLYEKGCEYCCGSYPA